MLNYASCFYKRLGNVGAASWINKEPQVNLRRSRRIAYRATTAYLIIKSFLRRDVGFLTSQVCAGHCVKSKEPVYRARVIYVIETSMTISTAVAFPQLLVNFP